MQPTTNPVPSLANSGTPAAVAGTGGTLQQGQQFMGGIVNYDTATGGLLPKGATTLATPSIASTIPASNLTQQPQTIPNSPNAAGSTNADSSVAGSIAATNSSNSAQQVTQQNQADQIAQGNNLGGSSQSVSGLQGNVQDAQGQYDQTNGQIQQLMQELGYKSSDIASLQQSANVPQLSQNITDLNTQLAQKTAAYNQQFQQIGSQNIPSTFVSGQLALAKQAAAVDIAGTSAQLQAAQGNLSTAQDTINNAINLKYGAITDQLTAQESYLKDNYDTLTNAQKVLADRQSQVIAAQKDNISNQQQTAIQAQKDLQTAITSSGLDPATGYQAMSDYLNGKISIGDFYNKIGGTTSDGSDYGTQVVNSTIDKIGSGVTGNMTLSQAIATAGIDNVVQAFIGQEGGSPSGVVNNPGNMKSDTAKSLGIPYTDSGVQATDGGTFASFATPQAGTDAVGKWLQSHGDKNLSDAIASYKGVTVNASSQDAATPDFLQGAPQSQIDAYNSLPPIQQSNVSNLVTGQALLSDLVTSKGVAGQNQRQQLIANAQKVDPTFSENTNKIRYAYNKDWNDATSSVGQTKVAINTALGHLADVSQMASQLTPSDLRMINSTSNWWKMQNGDPAITNLQFGLNNLADEIATAYKGGQPSQGEIDAQLASLGTQFSQAQFKGVFNTAAQFLSSKISSLNYNYKSTMGTVPPDPVINPDVRQNLVNAGIDPSVISPDPVTPAQQQFGSQLSKFGITDSGNNTLSIPKVNWQQLVSTHDPASGLSQADALQQALIAKGYKIVVS